MKVYGDRFHGRNQKVKLGNCRIELPGKRKDKSTRSNTPGESERRNPRKIHILLSLRPLRLRARTTAADHHSVRYMGVVVNTSVLVVLRRLVGD